MGPAPTPWISGRPRASPTPHRSLPCHPTSSSPLPTMSERPAMTLDEILASLFPAGQDVRNAHGMVFGSGSLRSGGRALIVGVANRTPLGVDDALRLSAHVL